MARVRELRVTYDVKETSGADDLGTMRSVADIARHVDFVRWLVDEEVWALFVDPEGNVISRYQVSKGGRHESMIDPASLYRAALLVEAAGIVLAHNHPCAGTRPSQADIEATAKLLLAGFALKVPLIDHLIVHGNETYSFGEAGMLHFLEAKALKAWGLPVPEVLVRPREDRANAASDALKALVNARGGTNGKAETADLGRNGDPAGVPNRGDGGPTECPVPDVQGATAAAMQGVAEARR
jgi:DNA repair protein RadC